MKPAATGHGRPRPSTLIAGALPALAVFGFIAVLTGAGANLYFEKATDLPLDYFYGAMLILHGQPLSTPLHPGTPLYYVLAAVAAPFDDPFADTGAVLLAGTLVAAGVTVLAIWRFIAVAAARGVSPWWALLALAPVFVWPPFWHYVACFGADALVIALCLLLATETWLLLTAAAPAPAGRLLALGLLAGFALAVKLVCLPVVLAAGLALALDGLAWRRFWRSALGFGAAAGLAFVTSIVPVFADLPNIVLMIVAPPAYLLGSVSDGAVAVSGMLRDQGGAVAIAVLGLGVLASLAAIAGCGTDTIRAARTRRRDALRALALAVLLGVPLLFVAKALQTVAAGYPGVALRNVSPAIAIIPFAVLALRARRGSAGGYPAATAAAGAVALLLIAAGANASWSAQTGHVEARLAAQRAYQAAIEARLAPGHVYADVNVMDQPTEHFDANQNYARHAFDEALARRFPDTTQVRLRAWRQVRATRQLLDDRRGAAGMADRVRDHWRGLFPRRYQPSLADPTLLAAAADGAPVQFVVALEAPLADCGVDCLAQLLRAQGHDITSVERIATTAGTLVFLDLGPAGD